MRLLRASPWLLAMACLTPLACAAPGPAGGMLSEVAGPATSVVQVDELASCKTMPKEDEDIDVIAGPHLTITGALRCPNDELKHIQFVTDTLVTSDAPLYTRNLLWVVDPGVRVTVVAPSVTIRRSEAFVRFPIVLSDGNIAFEVTDDMVKLPPGHSPVEKFGLTAALLSDTVGLFTNGKVFYSPYAISVSAKQASTIIAKPPDNGQPSAVSAGAAAAAGAAGRDAGAATTDGPPSTTGTSAAKASSPSVSASDDVERGSGLSPVAAAPGANGNKNVNDLKHTENRPADATPAPAAEATEQALTDDAVDAGLPTAVDDAASAADADRNVGAGAGQNAGETADNGGKPDFTTTTATTTTTTTTSCNNSSNDEPATTNNGNGGRDRAENSRSSGGGGGIDKPAATSNDKDGHDGSKDSNGSSSSGGGGGGEPSFPPGLLPENMLPHAGSSLKVGERLDGGLLSASKKSALYVHPEDASVVFSTEVDAGFAEEEEEEEENRIVPATVVMEPSEKKLAKVRQLRREIEAEEEEEEEKKLGAPRQKTKREALLGLQPFGKAGWLHRRAKERVKERAGEIDLAISDRGVLSVSVDGRVVLKTGARFGGVFRRRDSSYELVTTDVGYNILKKGKVVSSFDSSG